MTLDPLHGPAAGALGRAFDESFSRAPVEAVAAVPLLAVRVGGDALAVRLRETRGFERLRVVTPLPTERAELLGLCGVRGQLVPVFDLAVLLGAPAADLARWLILCGDEDPIGLAVSDFEGHAAAVAGDFLAAREGRRHVTQQVRLLGTLRGLVDVPAVVQDVYMRSAPAAAKER